MTFHKGRYESLRHSEYEVCGGGVIAGLQSNVVELVMRCGIITCIWHYL
jgi:hypothetical protein